MRSEEVSRFIPDSAIGVVGSSTSIILGDLNLIAGLFVAIVSALVLILRYLSYRKKTELELEKLEEELKILKRTNEL